MEVTMKRKVLNTKLLHTHEDIDDIYSQYYDGYNDFSEQSEKILFVINQLPKFEQDVFYLYSEYNSLRKVSDDVNINYVSVKKIMDRIRQDVNNCIINKNGSFSIIIKEGGNNVNN